MCPIKRIWSWFAWRMLGMSAVQYNPQVLFKLTVSSRHISQNKKSAEKKPFSQNCCQWLEVKIMKGKHLSHCKTKGQILLTIQTITYALPSHTQKDTYTCIHSRGMGKIWIPRAMLSRSSPGSERGVGRLCITSADRPQSSAHRIQPCTKLGTIILYT